MNVVLVNMTRKEQIKIRIALESPAAIHLKTPNALDAPDHKTVWGWAVGQTTIPTLYIVKGAGGFAGGNPQAKTAVIGDVFIDAVMGRFGCINRITKKYPTHGLPYKMLTKAAQVGAAQHEWAHVMDEDGVWEGHDEDRWWEG